MEGAMITWFGILVSITVVVLCVLVARSLTTEA
jgi:hypothetical protein